MNERFGLSRIGMLGAELGELGAEAGVVGDVDVWGEGVGGHAGEEMIPW